MKRYLSSFFLGVILLVPVMSARADDHDKRYYDRKHKDYHHWNADEDKAYRRYLEERRKEYRDWGKQRRSDQDAYWSWRHEHPDEHR